MGNKNWYVDWFNSPFYHKLYFQRDEKEAAAFIDHLIEHLQPLPGSRMLDIACGKGRYSRQLSDKGFFVTGIDLAPDSIEYARQFESDNLEFFQHDMRLPFRVNYYDFGFNFFTSFGYFASRREHEDAMRTMAGALKTGGKLIIDYLNPHYAEDHLIPEENRQIKDTSYEIHRWQEEGYFFKRIKVTDPTLSQPIEYTERVMKFSLGDFTEMLAYEHFQVKEVFGNYALQPYDVRKSPRLIVIAEKYQ